MEPEITKYIDFPASPVERSSHLMRVKRELSRRKIHLLLEFSRLEARFSDRHENISNDPLAIHILPVFGVYIASCLPASS